MSLLDGLKRREAEAWRRLARLYGPLVYGWCRRAGLQAADAEDVLQEVFLTVAQRITDFRHDQPGATFRGWLWTITRHKIGDWLRRQSVHLQAAGAMEQWAAPDNDADAPAPVGPLFQGALQLIREEFEERSWQAFWRVVVEQQSPADVAHDLGLSRNAVYIARSRILCRLRETLGDQT